MDRIAPISLQQSFWNRWNTSHREDSVGEVSRRQAEVADGWLKSLGRKDLDIVDVGCGTGWACRHWTRFGRVTGTDLSDEVLARAAHRAPEVKFVPGNFMDLNFGKSAFDVIVSFEVLSHIADQRAFVKKLASHLRPGGHLMLATQNRPALRYLNFLPRPVPGQLRYWVDRRELRELLEPEFEVLELFSVTPKVGSGLKFGLGIMRRINLRGLGGRIQANLGDHSTNPQPTTADQVSFATRPHWWGTRCLEAVGLGWTLMALARKPMSV